MSNDYTFRDLRLDILDVGLENIVDTSLRTRVRRFMNSREEKRKRTLAEEKQVEYGTSHSLVKGLYASLGKNKKSMPHMYESIAKAAVSELDSDIIPNAAQWCYAVAKRNGLVATFDEDLLYDLPLEESDYYGRANKGIVMLFDDAVSELGLSLRPFQVSSNSAVLSKVNSYFSPKKDVESLFLLYAHASQRRGTYSDEEI